MNETLTIKKSYVEAIRNLPKEEQLEVWDAIFDYGFNGETDCNNSIFEIIRPSIKGRKAKAKDQDISYRTWTKQQFIEDITKYGENSSRDIKNAFFQYWSEKGPDGKMRFQKEETWETDLRLIRWGKNTEKKTVNTNGFKTEIKNK